MNRFAGRIAQGVSLLLAIATLSLAAPLVNSAQATGTRPGAPTNVIAVADGSSVTLTWTAPASDGGSALTDYRVQYRDRPQGSTERIFTSTPWTNFTRPSSTSTTATIPGFTQGNYYEFRVAAENAIGVGPYNTRILVANISSSSGDSQCSIHEDKTTYCALNPPVSFDGATSATRVIEIASGGPDVTCLLFEIGKIKCNSSTNSYGQLGDGTTNVPMSSAWSDVVGIDGSTRAKTAAKVVVGKNHACALMKDGQVQCWGRNNDGQLGHGGTTNSSSPVYVDALTALDPATTAVDVATSDNGTCVILQDATVNCWGKLIFDTLGSISYFDGSSDATKASSFNGAPGLDGFLGNISGSGAGFCVITVSTQVVCWASSGGGGETVGPRDTNNTLQFASTPTLVRGVSGVTQLAQNVGAVCALFSDGSVGCWGSRDRGQLGDGSSAPSTGVVAVVGVKGLRATSVSVSNAFSFCATRGGDVDTVCWGEVLNEPKYEPVVVNHNRYFEVPYPDNSGGGGGGGGVGTPPATPALPQVVAGDGQVTATFVANTGGVTPTMYVIYAVGLPAPGKSCVVSLPASPLSCVIGGLTNGTAYTFQASACVNGGQVCSAPIGPTSPVTPSGGQGVLLPNVPVAPIAATGNGQATVTVVPNVGGITPTGYTVIVVGSNPAQYCQITNPAVSLSCDVTGLANGTSYTFQVVACTTQCSQPSGSSNAVTPASSQIPPSTPAAPTAVAGNGQVTVTVVPNVGGVAPTSYNVGIVGSNPPVFCTVTNPAVSLSCVISGLANGVSYTFQAVALAGGSFSQVSPPSNAVSPSAVSATPPGQPRNLVIATRTAGTLGVTWDAPASPGSSAITGYTVAWREAGKAWVAGNTKAVTARTATVTGLTAGKSYEFRVKASNVTSTGAWSTSTTGIVPVKAPAPQNFKGVAKGMQITVTWSKVTTPSHSPVVNYAVYCAVGSETPARAKVKPTETTATVTVTQHKRYVCRVAANTAAGRGTDSAPIRVSIK